MPPLQQGKQAIAELKSDIINYITQQKVEQWQADDGF